MRAIVPLFPLFCASLIAQQSVSQVGFSESRDAIRAFSPSGEVTLSLTHLQIEIRPAGGKSGLADLTVVYDPPSGHYFWLCRKANFPRDTASLLDELKSARMAVYAGPDAIVDFYMPANLGFQEHHERADSLSAAERASLDQIEKGLPTYANNGFDTGFREVEVARAIGIEFACPPYEDPTFRQNCVFGTKSIASISREGDNWRIVLRNRWDQEVILDSKFNLASTRRLPTPAKE
jgi:hypothetical protein